MLVIDTVLPEPKTSLDLFTARMNWLGAEFISRSAFSTKVPVTSPFNCWVCRKEFLAPGFAVYCSEACDTAGQAEEDMARDQ